MFGQLGLTAYALEEGKYVSLWEISYKIALKFKHADISISWAVS